jgi:hypothetical protein
MFVADLFKSQSRPEAENLFLRHQLNSQCGKRRLGHDCTAVTGLSWFG